MWTQFSLIFALVSLASGASIKKPNGVLRAQSSDPMYPELGLDQVLNPSGLGVPFRFHPSGKLSSSDAHKILVQLANPDNLRELLEDDAVLFDTSDLEVSQATSASAITRLAKDYMRYLDFSIRYFVFAETESESAHSRLERYINALRKDPNFHIKGLNKYRAYLSAIPQRAQLIKLTVEYLAKTFDTEVLSFVREYFYDAAEVDPEAERRLQSVIDTLMVEYNFLPHDYYLKVQKTIDDAVISVEKDREARITDRSQEYTK